MTRIFGSARSWRRRVLDRAEVAFDVAGGAEAGERFVVANGAEGEPGTFKDRALLRHNPYLMLEGLSVAARTVGARRVFVALKSPFEFEADRVALGAAEMASAGWADDVQIELVRGPDEYLFGEEKALLARLAMAWRNDDGGADADVPVTSRTWTSRVRC